MKFLGVTSTIIIAALCATLLPSLALARKKPAVPTVRWTDGAPGCTFERDTQDRLHWTLTEKDFDLNLIVDPQELAKSLHHGFYRTFALYLAFNYKGAGNFDFPADLRLDYVRHHDVIETTMDPALLQNKLQNDLDTKVFDTEREIKKHPERKDEKVARLRIDEKEGAEFIEFLSTQYLSSATLNSGNPEAHGWVLFPTRNKFIGPWKEHEDFILSVYSKGRVWQFPISLPPAAGNPVLRKPEN
ncbi:MAG TPA: hypothetical protein VMI10_21845 [Terriglobales bacterium]|nr:hypothetical protein [Terriglobales bacterium]